MTTNYQEKVKKIRTSELVGYWPLDEESGTIAFDHSANGYNGTSASLVRLPATRGFTGPDGGRCAQFDGSASYVDINAASSASAVGLGTVMAWVATPSSSLNTTTKATVVFLAADSANEISIFKDTTANSFSANYSAGSGDATYSTTNCDTKTLPFNDYWQAGAPKWLHVAMTFTTATGAMLMYTNGEPSTACATIGTWTGAFADTITCIGTAKTNLGTMFTGYISHVAWWKVPLTETEIRDLADAGP